MKRPRTSHNKLEEAGTCRKQLQTSGTKKSLLLCGLPIILIDIEWFWIALIVLGKYFLIEIMAFLLMPNICFHDAQISWNNIFSVSSHSSSTYDYKLIDGWFHKNQSFMSLSICWWLSLLNKQKRSAFNFYYEDLHHIETSPLICNGLVSIW